jgi:hypothetical protein
LAQVVEHLLSKHPSTAKKVKVNRNYRASMGENGTIGGGP